MRTLGVAATIGMFDGVHRGHVHLLRQLREVAAARGLKPVAFTFSDHPLSVIAPQRVPELLMPAGRRVEALRRESVEAVVMDFADVRSLTASEFMRKLAREYDVRMLVMGFNHGFGCDRINDFETYRRLGAEAGLEVLRASEVGGPTVSSSLVRKAVAGGDVAVAGKLLGRHYELAGVVVPGRRLGRKLGFPTANIKPCDSRQLVPAEGVYACYAVVGSREYPAMVNIGRRPTVDRSAHPERSIEAHIIGFDGDLYAQALDLRFVERLRGEIDFGSLDALKAGLECDRAAVLKALARV